MIPLLRTIVIVAMLTLVAAGCDGGGDGDDPNRLEDGETLGEIERIAGGTAVPTDTRTLASVACSAGEVVIITDRERIRGDMECERMFPAEILDRFIGEPVAIRAEGGRLIVENETEGTLEFPVEEPSLGEPDAAP